jgi:PAS domain S-box-containing protein
MTRSGRTQSDQFRQIAEINGDVAWIVDCPSGALNYLSPAAEGLFGYGRDAIAAAIFDSSLAEPALFAICTGLAERLQRFADGDATRLQLLRQFDLHHPDGSVIPLEVCSTLMLDEQGLPDSLVGIVRNVSERREREAEQKRFASMLNHEFRTPLSTIDGAIQRLESTGSNADEPTRQRYRKIGAAVDRLIEMLDQYLSPDRMQAIGRKLQATSASPQQLLEEAAALARQAGREATVLASDLPQEIRCEPAGLRLALKVLIDNALQYTPNSAVITLSGNRAEGGIELLASDNGPGVPPNESELIFAKGYRGANAAECGPGSGLGLYMARSVIEVHGGNLTVHKPPTGGAAFRIWLPAQGGAGKKVASDGHSSDNSLDQLPGGRAVLKKDRAKGN